jgi:hypothetical protein
LAEPHILPLSVAPLLDSDASHDDHVGKMVAWFFENFEDPANSLPYESAEGGYQWLWGGPHDAVEELNSAFPDATENEISDAIVRIQNNNVYEWSVADRRIVSGREQFIPQEASFGERRRPPLDHQRAFSIVETLLYPVVTWQFGVRVTFIPGNTNEPLGTELDSESRVLTTEDGEPIEFEDGQFLEIKGDASALIQRGFSSLRALVVGLIDMELESTIVGNHSALEGAREWINSLERDSDLFVDDAIVVHASPPAWMPLAKLFGKGVDASGVSAIVLLADSPGMAVGMLLTYGGARIFVRLVHGVNFLQDSFFERVGERIQRGDYDCSKVAAGAGASRAGKNNGVQATQSARHRQYGDRRQCQFPVPI